MKVLRLWKIVCAYLFPRSFTDSSKPPMLVAVTKYQVRTTARDGFLQASIELAGIAIKTDGNMMMEIYTEEGDPSMIWMMERWSSAHLYDQYKTSSAVKDALLASSAHLVSPAEAFFLEDLELYEQYSSEEYSAQQIIVMLLVDLKQRAGHEFRAINRKMIAAFGEDTDLMVFRLSRVLHCRSRFVVYKRFRTRRAFQFHLRDPAVATVIRFLQASVRHPPFEGGYHQLVQVFPGKH